MRPFDFAPSGRFAQDRPLRRAHGPLLIAALALLAGLAAAPLALAQEGPKQEPPAEGAGRDAKAPANPILDAAREAYGFASWPGKDGPSRDGIGLPALAGLEEVASSDPRLDLRALPGGPVATLVAGEGLTRALVWVEETPAAAQERLLTWLAGSARRLLRLAGKTAPGEVAFAAGDAEVATIAFARANVAVVVTAPVALAPALARRIDAMIGESPLLEGKRARTLALAKLHQAQRDPTTPAGTDPIYGLTAKGAIARDVRAEGGVAIESGDSIVLRGDGTRAVTRLIVHLLSARGWRTTVASDDAPTKSK